MVATNGLKVGDRVARTNADLAPGNLMSLQDIPVGTQINNVECSWPAQAVSAKCRAVAIDGKGRSMLRSVCLR